MKPSRLPLFTLAAALTAGWAGFAPISVAQAQAEPHEEAAPSAADDLLTVLEADPQFSTLVSLIKTAGLEDTLRTGDNFTLFAPNNAAFENADPEVIEQVTAKKGILKKTLLGHVLDQKLVHADLQTKIDTAAVSGRKIKVRFKQEKVLVNGRELLSSDLMASNGVIHVIGKAILPRNKNKTESEPG